MRRLETLCLPRVASLEGVRHPEAHTHCKSKQKEIRAAQGYEQHTRGQECKARRGKFCWEASQEEAIEATSEMEKEGNAERRGGL